MKNFIVLLVISMIISLNILAQNEPQPTSTTKRLNSIIESEKQNKTNMVQNIKFRNVGPTVMSGRVVDLAVNPDDPHNFYVAYATGGVWVTKNNGLSFDPIFDNEATLSIGDIAVDWKNQTIWVGTGEANAFTWAGLGVYKSTDMGKTWEHVGLTETEHINRIVLHPENKHIAWVAGMGRLYTHTPDRGIYKTADGGKTWQKTLFVDDSTGITDMIIDPKNPDILYAASWERWRKSWLRHKGGKGSGVFKSIDGGETWERLNLEGSGFPIGEDVGRIGLTIYPDDPNILYATVDNQARREKDEDEDVKTDDFSKEFFKDIAQEDFLKIDNDKLNAFLKRNDFPEKYTAEKVKKMVGAKEIKPAALYEYLVDPTSPPEDERPIYGAEIYRSNDAGKTWFRTHSEPLDGLFFTYGYVFDIIRVSANNPDKFYVMGVPILLSEDGGKTFKNINEGNVHVDHHALWVNPDDDNYIINGNDGGVNISYDSGLNWLKANPIPVGQCYTVEYDMAEPYNIYTGMQDNGTWIGPSRYTKGVDWQQTGRYPYESLMGGDGFQVEVDFRDNNTMYMGFQYGYYFRLDKTQSNYEPLKVKPELGERPLRWNWETPILLSRHNEDIVYIGSNKLYRSMDKGKSFMAISPDLTKGGRIGEVKYGTITTISESAFKFGMIYVGTDDGNVQLTRDGGSTWELISDGLPQNLWVSRVEASKHKEGRVYVSLNGLKWDHYDAHVFISEDFGKTWKRIGTDLPQDMVNVVREDPKNENIIYVGNQIGAYVSLNGGESFMKFKSIPNVAVFDMKIHPRENELLLGTHGRSIYSANVKHLQQFTPDLLKKDLYLFEIDKIKFNPSWGDKYSPWDKPEEPKVEIAFYSNKYARAEIIVEAGGVVLAKYVDEVEKGLNYFDYNLVCENKAKEDYEEYLNELKRDDDGIIKLKKADNGKIYLKPGKYQVTISIEGAKISSCIEVIS